MSVDTAESHTGRSRSSSLSTMLPTHPLTIPSSSFKNPFMQSPSSAAPPPLSISPTASSVSDEIKTPPSSSPKTFFTSTAKSPIVGQGTTSALDDELFANGARWGFAPNARSAPAHQRRASISTGVGSVSGQIQTLGFGSPPTSSAANMMAPLGRVTSAGARLSGSAEPANGWGIFRRFSTGGPGPGRKPSPPPSTASIPEISLPPTATVPDPITVAPASTADSTDRGRRS